MLKRLRKDFIVITMALVGVVLVVALGSTWAGTYTTQHEITAAMLERALKDPTDTSSVPQIGDPNGLQNTESMLTITVDVTSDATVLARSSSPVSISSDTLYAVIVEALSSNSNSGESDEYPISWMKTETTMGYRIALADTYSRDSALRKQAVIDVCIVVVSMGVLYFVVRKLADWSLRPVENAWDRQRRFVSDASHELKTPLAVILANTQILVADKRIPEESRRWIVSTDDEAKHMKGLVEDLLTLARADEEAAEGGLGAKRGAKDIDLSSLADGCALEFDAVAFERGCTIETALAEGVHVMGDSEQVGRAVRTLLDNATKYAEKGTAVRLALVRDGQKARLSVNNKGEAIAPDDLAHLFDRFYRTDSARERQAQGGFGLGLAIAKSIIEAHNGTIVATSSAVEGTTFTVTLPLA